MGTTNNKLHDCFGLYLMCGGNSQYAFCFTMVMFKFLKFFVLVVFGLDL